MDNRNQPAPMMTHAQAEEMLHLQRQANKQRGCLLAVLWTLLFGVFYWAWLAVKWTAIATWALLRLGWRWTVTYPARWTVALSRWSVQVATPWLVTGAQRFHARYGAKGWAIVGAVAVVVVILGSIIGTH